MKKPSMSKATFLSWVQLQLEPLAIQAETERVARFAEHDPKVAAILQRYEDELVAYLRSRVEK